MNDCGDGDSAAAVVAVVGPSPVLVDWKCYHDYCYYCLVAIAVVVVAVVAAVAPC